MIVTTAPSPTVKTSRPSEAPESSTVSAEERFLTSAHSGRNCFLTGAAGTGKSTVLRQFVSEQVTGIRNGLATLGIDPVDVDITAPTGIAALNVNGLTIHRFAGIMLGPKDGETDEEYADELRRSPYPSVKAGRNRIMRCKILVIDEISMLPGRQMDFLNYYFKWIRSDDRPFGGIQIIVVGDFHQLPPVRIGDSAPYDWAFLSQAWRECGFQTTHLTVPRRQDDKAFVSALMDFRVGRVMGDTAQLLSERVIQHPSADIPRLYTHNVQKDKWNTLMLDEMAGPMITIEAVCEGPDTQIEFLKKNLRTPATLKIKLGALVMFTVNEKESKYVNGLLGKVIDYYAPDTLEIEVMRMGGNTERILLPKFTWRYSKDKHSATFTQFPLVLAYALTIHKAQGLTLDRAHCDIRAAREPGQAYVAVSRVRKLSGLSLKEFPKGVFTSSVVRKFYEQ